MITIQEKVLGEIERIAKTRDCEVVTTPNQAPGSVQLYVMCGWETAAVVDVRFAGAVMHAEVNGRGLGDGSGLAYREEEDLHLLFSRVNATLLAGGYHTEAEAAAAEAAAYAADRAMLDAEGFGR